MAAREHWIPLGDRAEEEEQEDEKEEKRGSGKRNEGKKDNLLIYLVPKAPESNGWMIVHERGSNYKFKI